MKCAKIAVLAINESSTIVMTNWNINHVFCFFAFKCLKQKSIHIGICANADAHARTNVITIKSSESGFL